MKVTAIEIAEAIEKEITRYLEEESDRNEMRFTRFIDLGGKQLDIYLYPPVSGATVWCVVGIKSVYRDEQGDCMIYNVAIPDTDRRFEYVQVSPVEEDLPDIAQKIVDFLKDDLKAVNEGTALEGGNLALENDGEGKGVPAEEEGSGMEEAPSSDEPESDRQISDGEPVEEDESSSSDDKDKGPVEGSEESEEDEPKESGA